MANFTDPGDPYGYGGGGFIPAGGGFAQVADTAEKAPAGTLANPSAVQVKGAPAAGYLAMIPGSQPVGSGSAKNITKIPGVELYPSVLTGNGTQSDASMWANPGYMTVAAGATAGGLELPLAYYNPDYSAKGQVIAITVKGAAPAAIYPWIGQGNGYYGTLGLAINVTTQGKLQLQVFTQPGFTVVGIGTSNFAYFDGTEHSMFLYVHPSGYVALFRDGEIDFVATPDVTATVLGKTVSVSPFTIGCGAGAPNALFPAIAMQCRGLHLMSLSDIPLNLGHMAKAIASNPMRPLEDADIVYPKKTVCLFWGAGQSNEFGAGNTNGSTGTLGVPHRDLSGRSIIAGLSLRLAQRGIAAIWAQTAFGSTGLCDAWAGRIRPWSASMNVLGGTYVSYNGKCWKVNNGTGYTGTSTVVPVATTGVDGVTWVDLGALTAEDSAALAGTGVYSPYSSRFDPTGLIATALSKAMRCRSTVSELVALISIGQGDVFTGAVQATYADALKKVAQKLLDGGANKVLMGLTCRDSGAGDAWYTNHLIPARKAAISAMTYEKRVFAGHDWATDVGFLTVQTLPINIGVRTDNVHMTDVTYETRAVPSTDAALAAAGL